MLLAEKGVFVEGDLVLLPPLVFGQNSIYQRYEDYPIITHSNHSYSFVLSDALRFSADVVLKQGYPNWYMLVYAFALGLMRRYRGELLMAEQDDCLRWNLELDDSDPFFEVVLLKWAEE